MSALYPQNIPVKSTDITKLCMGASPVQTPADYNYEECRVQSQMSGGKDQLYVDAQTTKSVAGKKSANGSRKLADSLNVKQFYSTSHKWNSPNRGFGFRSPQQVKHTGKSSEPSSRKKEPSSLEKQYMDICKSMHVRSLMPRRPTAEGSADQADDEVGLTIAAGAAPGAFKSQIEKHLNNLEQDSKPRIITLKVSDQVVSGKVGGKTSNYNSDLKTKRSASLGRHCLFQLNTTQTTFRMYNEQEAPQPRTPRIKQTRHYKNLESESESEAEEVKEKSSGFSINILRDRTVSQTPTTATVASNGHYLGVVGLSHVDEWSAGEEEDSDSVDHDEDDADPISVPFESEQEIKKKAVTKVKSKKAKESTKETKQPSKKQSAKQETKQVISPKKKGSQKEEKKKAEDKKSTKNTKFDKMFNKKEKHNMAKEYAKMESELTPSPPKKKQPAPQISKEHSRADLVSNLAPVASPQKGSKKKKNVVNIAFAAPKNVEEQYNLFFANDCEVNPKFEYENPALAQNYVNNFQPHQELLELSKHIMELTLRDYGSETNYNEHNGGRMLDIQESRQRFEAYLDDLDLKEYISLVFKEHACSSTAVAYEKNGKAKLIIRVPVEYRDKGIISTLHHEIGTHYLRKLNERQQAWFLKKKKYDLKNCIITEEGFATTNMFFNSAIDRRSKPYLFRSAMIYYSAYQASRMSFVELYNDLKKYVDRPLRRQGFTVIDRWQTCVRVKRGLVDTEQPGGLYKDQVYLIGVVNILMARRFFDLRALYAGKIGLQDFNKPQVQKKIKLERLALPPFMDNYEKYLSALDVIAKTNGIDSYVLKRDLNSCLPTDIMQRLPLQSVPQVASKLVIRELLALRKEKDAGELSDKA